MKTLTEKEIGTVAGGVVNVGAAAENALRLIEIGTHAAQLDHSANNITGNTGFPAAPRGPQQSAVSGSGVNPETGNYHN